MNLPWRVELFGGLAAHSDTRAIRHFQTQKTGALLAYLALFPNRTPSREQLAEMLWPEVDPERGRVRLRTALASLRRQLEPPGVPQGSVLVATRNTLRLQPAAFVTDVAEFEAAVSAASQASNAERRREHLQQAVALYRGELLSGWYEEWVFAEQRRLEAAFNTALWDLTVLHEQAGDLPSALECSMRFVQGEPLHEPAYQTLIRLALQLNRPATALEFYRILERTLKEQLDTKPSLEARRMVEPLLRATSPAVDLKEPSLAAPSASASHPDSAVSNLAFRLPSSHTRFFGRQEEIEHLVEMLRNLTLNSAGTDLLPPPVSARLVTLIGPGGSGKTRLALEVARRLQPTYATAVWFVSFADVADVRALPEALVDGMRLPRTSDADPMELVAHALAQQSALLVLDNFEHLVEQGAGTIQEIRDRVPDLTCLVTSRQALLLEGEREFPIEPLPTPSVPGTPERILEFPSVQLFVDRAQAIRPDFQVTPRNAAAVAALCHQLEGIPLALELAANWVRVWTIGQIREQLSRRFDLLAGNRKGVVARHQTMRAAIEGSLRLLSPELQAFFFNLSVFRGGWDLEAAQAVSLVSSPAPASEASAKARTLNLLYQLRLHSLILSTEVGEKMRYRMLETLREYAQEEMSPETRDALVQRHADYFLQLTQQAAPHTIKGEQGLWMDRLEADHNNIRAVLEGALAQGQARLALEISVAMGSFWHTRGYHREGHDRLKAALTAYREPDGLRAKGLYDLALHHKEETTAEIRAWIEESLQICRRTDDTVGKVRALTVLSDLLGMELRDTFQEQMACLEGFDDLRNRAQVLHKLGLRFMHTGKLTEARRYLTESAEIKREIGDLRALGISLVNLGWLAVEEWDYPTAQRHFEKGEAVFEGIGDPFCLALAWVGAGWVAYRRGEFETSRAHYLRALEHQEKLQVEIYQGITLRSLGDLSLRRNDLSAARDCYRRSLILNRNTPNAQTILFDLDGLAAVLHREGRLEQAARCYGCAQALYDQKRIARVYGKEQETRQDVEALRQALGELRFLEESKRGSALTWEQAAEEAYTAESDSKLLSQFERVE